MKKDKSLLLTNSNKLCRIKSTMLGKNNTKKLAPIILFISSVFFFGFLQQTNTADATTTTTTTSLDQAIQQFQNNLQSSIAKQIQSVDNITNGTNCSNSISIQTQTNDNGQTSSTTKNTCNNNSIFSASSVNPLTARNLSGAIVSSEYDLQTGKIINSLFGNWSLKNNNDGQIDFKTTFTKQPLDLSSKRPDLSSSANQTSVENNKTEYNLSNLRVTTVTQQNSDITYKGTIDVFEKNISSGIKGKTTTNTFENADAAISILDGRILVINFDKQSSLSNEFRDIPLVGVVVI